MLFCCSESNKFKHLVRHVFILTLNRKNKRVCLHVGRQGLKEKTKTSEVHKDLQRAAAVKQTRAAESGET